MVYILDLAFGLLVVMTGFSASWIGLELARMSGWRLALDGTGFGPRPLLALLVTALVGPRLLLAGGFEKWRGGAISLALYGLMVLTAAGWSAMSGVLVLQLAFASGFFLA
ncbi:hypothetical protein DFR52_101681 [Hoeflea marina]|uniref:Uncharacterized protein n=1 Tax=Hoeflea marina TaxID=274592 RepID=A0A317PRA6_9HYPH|nr:hypothetical protein [Hoeflea marina]PWW03992.1 hypothetical protein DFR52_101681 [Hoeflea marina]